jgi:2-oxoglutarate dehydrogenase E1 component
LTKEKADEIKKGVDAELNKAYEKSKSYEFKVEEWMSDEWESIKNPKEFGKVKDTGISTDILKDIGNKITTLPDDWDFHPQIKKIYELRKKSIQDGKQIDWGTAEALAFASLIQEGFHVRLSGQDVERGTFSHRHGIVFHQSKDTRYIPINSVKPH